MSVNSPQMMLSSRHTTLLLVLILGLFPLVGMTVDLISPSLPAMSESLHMSHALTKNMISIYLIGYGIGSFIFGFLSDAWGRKKILLSGLSAFVIVSLFPVIWPHPFVMLAVRFFEGVSMSCFSVNARPIASDILPPKKALSFFVFVATMWGIGPIIGPWIGGYLQVYFGWQACFIFFAIYAFIVLILLGFSLPETHLNRHPFSLKKVQSDFILMITHRQFIGSIMVMAFSYTLLIAFNTLGPFLFQIGFGYSPIAFGHVALYMGTCFLIGTFICRFFVKKEWSCLIYKFILPLAFLISLMGLVAAYFMNHSIPLALILSLSLFVCCGVFNPAATGFGMTIFPDRAGSSSAIMYFVNLLITSTIAFSLSFINVANLLPVALVYFILMSTCTLGYFFMMRCKSKNTCL